MRSGVDIGAGWVDNGRVAFTVRASRAVHNSQGYLIFAWDYNVGASLACFCESGDGRPRRRIAHLATAGQILRDRHYSSRRELYAAVWGFPILIGGLFATLYALNAAILTSSLVAFSMGRDWMSPNSEVEIDVPAGLGAQHVAAASVTRRTAATAVVVSATDGDVRVFSDGKLVLQMDPDVADDLITSGE